MKGSDYMYHKLITDGENYEVGKDDVIKIEIKQAFNTYCFFKITFKDGRIREIPLNRGIYAEEGPPDHLKLVKEKK
jgi:hypothetical protein